MNYSAIRKCDIANGLGWRVTLWVCGCSRKCPGCFNPDAQNPEYGKLFDDEAKEKIFKELANPIVSGLSLMGGEPMSKLSDNRKQVIQLCKECKEKFPDKDIWMWSGYTFEELKAEETTGKILDYIDVLVDGPFVQEKKDPSCPYRGSTNQRVIDIRNTMANGNIIEMKF